MKHIGKSVVGITMAVAMLASMASCKSGNGRSSAVAANAKNSSSTASESSTSSSAVLSPLTVTVFDAGGGVMGTPSGWWAKAAKDKFNITFNVLSPNIAGTGDAMYQTRVAAGNLGDIFCISDAKMIDCIKSGLVLDITSYLQGQKNIARFSIATKNTQKILGTGDKVYALATGASMMPPTTPQLDSGNPNFGPYMRWDYYKELGYPDMKNYDDMLNVLKEMQQKHPKSDSGKKTYGISLFKDWDGTYMAFASKFAYMYGYREMNDDFIFINEDATKQIQITDENGPYYKALAMMFKANQMGLLDPDSPTNTWDTLTSKVKDSACLFQPWPWTGVDNVNTIELGNKGIGWAFVPVDDMILLATGVNPYGQGSCVGVGSKAKEPQRLVDFIDWMGSEDETWFAQNGPEGLAWEVQSGKPVLTDYGKTAQAKDSPVPTKYGGGTWNKGGSPFSFGLQDTRCDINTTYNEPFTHNSWSSTIAANQTALTADWNKQMGAASVLDYLNKNNKQVVSPGNTYVRPDESSTMKTEKTQCANTIKTASWQMIFAKDQSQFDSIWTNMKKQLDGFGYQDVLKTEQTYVEGYRTAIAQTLKDTGD